MISMEELIQECPCCQSKNIVWEKSIAPETSGYYQECCDCGLRTACWGSPQKALEHWNTRPTPELGIEWVGECDRCYGAKKFREASKPPHIVSDCPKCNGTGTITRPATLEEVLEKLPKIIEKLSWFYDNNYYHDKLALIINNGTLRVKEGE